MKKFISWVFILLSLQLSFAQKKQKPDPLQYVRQDTSKALTSQQLVTLLMNLKQKAYAQLRGKEKSALDKQLKKLDEQDSSKRKKAAYTLSSAAMMMMGASENKEIVIVLATAPAENYPADPVLVSNFSALLRALDSGKICLPVLEYAKQLDPSSPVILTNLGNSLFELYDDRNAEIFFKRALKIDNHFKDARSSLVLVYLKRKEFGKAYEELMKGVEEVNYNENTKQEFAVVVNNADRIKQSQTNPQVPPPPAGPAASASSGGGNTAATLVLPPFPDWADLKTFMASKAAENWQKEISKGFRACIDETTESAKRQADQILHGGYTKYINSPFRKTAERNEYAMSIMQQYTEERYNRILKDYSEAEDKNGARFTKDFERAAEEFNRRSKKLTDDMQAKLHSADPVVEKAATGQGITKQQADKAGSAIGEALSDLPEYKKLLIEYCHTTKQLTEDHFAEWKINVKILHNKTNDLLKGYWAYCEQYLNQVYDNDYERINNMRILYVYGKLSFLAGTYTAMPLAFLTSFTTSSGNCSDATATALNTAAEVEMKTIVPKKKAPPCPWENGGKLKVRVGPCIVTSDCSGIEYDCLDEPEASVKTNWGVHAASVTLVDLQRAYPGATDFHSLQRDHPDAAEKLMAEKTHDIVTSETPDFDPGSGTTWGAVTGINTNLGTETVSALKY